ncbi:DNA-directed RNA polymerase, omega subunit [Parafrankia sp. EUN1f]|nr:DNA-directed RNA polymerase, omega subunit [Parafrankia sp. EUN1f]
MYVRHRVHARHRCTHGIAVPKGPARARRGAASHRPTRKDTVSGTVAQPEGITNPPIDELLEATDSKYSLVIYAAKRARQINAYYSQLGEGLLEYVGPLVETTSAQEKPLSIALREINSGLLTHETITDPLPPVS